MKTIDVPLMGRAYPIAVGSSVLADAADICLERLDPTSVALVSHPRLMALYGERAVSGFRDHGLPVAQLTVPAGERYKTLRSVEGLYRQLVRCGIDRKGLIVSLGGGVLGDICGFTAATYLRGIDFVQLPTTLLAQVDASVGGKTGVDLPDGKNLVGAFHQPRAVIIDTDTLSTLPFRELRSGLAEVVKYGIITDEHLFGDLERTIPLLLRRDVDALTHVIVRSCEIKADVVGKDEREEGVRAILNFGHTVGHALEVVTRYRRYRHGEAISIGMVAACLIGEAVGVTPPDVTHVVCQMLGRLRLPTAFPSDVDIDTVIDATTRDKKRVGAHVTYILAEGIGKVRAVKGIERVVVSRSLHRQKHLSVRSGL